MSYNVRFNGDEAIFENFQGEEITLSNGSFDINNDKNIPVDWGYDEEGKKIIQKTQINNQDVGENFKKYNGKRLIFRNCLNLKKIELDCLNLTGLEIENCPKLEHLSARNNEIERMDLSGLKNLKFVNFRDNQLKKINLDGCENLKVLNCAYNRNLGKLNVSHLKKLKTLFCEDCRLNKLNCSGLDKLEELTCFDNIHSVLKNKKIVGLKKLNIEGCKALKILDCAENSLEELTLDNHQDLHTVSCKGNQINDLVIKDCPNLGLLDFSRQGVFMFDERENQTFRASVIPTNLYTNSSSSLERILFTEDASFLTLYNETVNGFTYSVVPQYLEFEDFPNLKFYGFGTDDDPNFEAWLDKKRQEEQEQKYFNNPHPTPSISPEFNNLEHTIPAENFREPVKKDKKVFFSLPGMWMSGKLTIENWPNLRILNVSDNFLTGLVIKNCPELVSVIYSHNRDLNEESVIIKDCPNLETKFSYNSDKNKPSSKPTQEEQAFIDERLARQLQQDEEDEGYQSDEETVSESDPQTILAFINNPEATVAELLTLNLNGMEVDRKADLLTVAERLLAPLNFEQLNDIKLSNNQRVLADLIIKLMGEKFKEEFSEFYKDENKKGKSNIHLLSVIPPIIDLNTKEQIVQAIKELRANKKNYFESEYREILTNLEVKLHKLESQQNLSSQNSQQPDGVFSPFQLIFCIIFAFVVVLTLFYKEIRKEQE